MSGSTLFSIGEALIDMIPSRHRRQHAAQLAGLDALPATTMKPLNEISKFENYFLIRTVRFQVQLEADGCFSAQKIFVFASAASRYSAQEYASSAP